MVQTDVEAEVDTNDYECHSDDLAENKVETIKHVCAKHS